MTIAEDSEIFFFLSKINHWRTLLQVLTQQRFTPKVCWFLSFHVHQQIAKGVSFQILEIRPFFIFLFHANKTLLVLLDSIQQILNNDQTKFQRERILLLYYVVCSLSWQRQSLRQAFLLWKNPRWNFSLNKKQALGGALVLQTLAEVDDSLPNTSTSNDEPLDSSSRLQILF